MIREDNKNYFTIEEGDLIVEWMKQQTWSFNRLGQALFVTESCARRYVMGVMPVPDDVVERFRKLNIKGVIYNA